MWKVSIVNPPKIKINPNIPPKFCAHLLPRWAVIVEFSLLFVPFRKCTRCAWSDTRCLGGCRTRDWKICKLWRQSKILLLSGGQFMVGLWNEKIDHFLCSKTTHFSGCKNTKSFLRHFFFDKFDGIRVISFLVEIIVSK